MRAHTFELISSLKMDATIPFGIYFACFILFLLKCAVAGFNAMFEEIVGEDEEHYRAEEDVEARL